MGLTDPYQNELGPYREEDPETAKAAALDNFPRSGSQRRRVLHSIVLAGERGRTRDELATQLELPDSSTDGRVWELLKGGWIEANSEKRPTQTGSMAEVVVLTEEAVDVLIQNPELLP